MYQSHTSHDHDRSYDTNEVGKNQLQTSISITKTPKDSGSTVLLLGSWIIVIGVLATNIASLIVSTKYSLFDRQPNDTFFHTFLFKGIWLTCFLVFFIVTISMASTRCVFTRETLFLPFSPWRNYNPCKFTSLFFSFPFFSLGSIYIPLKQAGLMQFFSLPSLVWFSWSGLISLICLTFSITLFVLLQHGSLYSAIQSVHWHTSFVPFDFVLFFVLRIA